MSDTFLPLRFTLTAGARHDVTQAPTLITGYTCQYIIADAAYDSDALRETIVAQGAVAVIRPRKNRVEDRPYDKEVYKRRNVIERFFHRLKQYRRVATRYDKYADRYLGFVYFAALLINAKKNVNTTYLFWVFTIIEIDNQHYGLIDPYAHNIEQWIQGFELDNVIQLLPSPKIVVKYYCPSR